MGTLKYHIILNAEALFIISQTISPSPPCFLQACSKESLMSKADQETKCVINILWQVKKIFQMHGTALISGIFYA